MNFNNQIYRLSLDDYSAASFTSFGKDYFGTLDTIQDFILSLQNDKTCAETYKTLIDAFNKYQQGNKDITHNVAYKEVPFLVPVKIIGVTTSSLENYYWEHINTWGCPYNMKSDKVFNAHLWISCKGTYARCIKSVFTNLTYEHINSLYSPPGMIWGFPHQIENNNNETYNRLFVIEKTFNNKKEAIEDFHNFKTKQDPIFTEVLNDIFGDG